MSNRLSYLKAVLALAALSACSDGALPVTPEPEAPAAIATDALTYTGGTSNLSAAVVSVAVTPASGTRQVGATLALTGTAYDGAGIPRARVIDWTTSDSAIATISATGLFTARAPGIVTITATTEGVFGNAIITVTTGPVKTVTLSPTSVSLLQGATRQFAATPKDSAGFVVSGGLVTWSSSSTAIATVSSAGLVTAVGAGTAIITASSAGKSGTAAVTVSVTPTQTVATVSISPTAVSLGVGNSAQLTATLKDILGIILTGKVTTWSTSNAAIATVTPTGLVAAVGAGNATITATSGGKSSTMQVMVTAAPGGFLAGDILNNASFESGWDAMRDGGVSDPTGVSRSTTQHYGTGAYAILKTLPSGNATDQSSNFHYAFYNRDGQNGYVNTGHGVDRLYSRFWFKVDRTFNGTMLKLQVFQQDGFDKFSEYGFFQNYLTFNFSPEWGGGVIRIASLASINDGRWHSLETDMQLNGNMDAGADYPSAKIWFDGVDLSIAAPVPFGGTAGARLGRWINGRINAGSRSAYNTGQKIGVWSGPNILNANNPVAGNVWVDNIAISTRGRVGP